jgi:4-hydroxy-tetrahydrodipicolinate reductase
VIPIVLVGAAGRMGRAVEEAARTADDLEIKARIDRAAPQPLPGVPGPGADPPGYADPTGPDGIQRIQGVEALGAVLARGDVAVDFTSPEGCARAARACAAAGAALVTGTTAIGADAEAALDEAARRVAVLRAPNFSLGLLALRRAVAAALASLPDTWDVEIVERHHRRKEDSPSGTAWLLAREAAAARGGDIAFRHGRDGRLGQRPQGEIGLHAVRGGTWTGDHAVLIAGDGESLELRHVAESRAAFAHGVLAAIRFVAASPAGLYTLEDVPPPKRAP